MEETEKTEEMSPEERGVREMWAAYKANGRDGIKAVFQQRSEEARSAALKDLEEQEKYFPAAACSHPGCTTLVNPEDPYFSTLCGPYCGQHMRLHIQDCEICNEEFSPIPPDL